MFEPAHFDRFAQLGRCYACGKAIHGLQPVAPVAFKLALGTSVYFFCEKHCQAASTFTNSSWHLDHFKTPG